MFKPLSCINSQFFNISLDSEDAFEKFLKSLCQLLCYLTTGLFWIARTCSTNNNDLICRVFLQSLNHIIFDTRSDKHRHNNSISLLDFLLLIHFLNYRFQIRETPDYKIWQDAMDAEFGGGKFGDQRGAIRPRRGASNSLQHNTSRNFLLKRSALQSDTCCNCCTYVRCYL